MICMLSVMRQCSDMHKNINFGPFKLPIPDRLIMLAAMKPKGEKKMKKKRFDC